MNEKIIIHNIGELPSTWDDLVDHKLITIASIWTLKEINKNSKTEITEGIRKSDDGVWDIYVDAPEITEALIKKWLPRLAKKMGVELVYNP